MVVSYYVKLFRTGANRYNGTLMSLLPLVTETIKILLNLQLTKLNSILMHALTKFDVSFELLTYIKNVIKYSFPTVYYFSFVTVFDFKTLHRF